jgi:Rps23 Pro-64 3,4-dihydroxylase Tpa1-like proline 4-hydroxylase
MQNGKFGYRPMTLAGQESLRLLELCNSEPMARFLEALTGHRDLQPDDEAIGGGFHEMVQGGHLSIHADFSKHPKRRLARRINLLLYLQPDWDETWGGELELWHPDLRGLAARIVPHFNRAVIFDTTATSFHGHPQPLTCPPNQSRKSLALYFYNRPKFCERLTTRTLWRP